MDGEQESRSWKICKVPFSSILLYSPAAETFSPLAQAGKKIIFFRGAGGLHVCPAMGQDEGFLAKQGIRQNMFHVGLPVRIIRGQLAGVAANPGQLGFGVITDVDNCGDLVRRVADKRKGHPIH